MQRKVFAGSRHTKTLSLVASCRTQGEFETQAPQEPANVVPQVSPIDTRDPARNPIHAVRPLRPRTGTDDSIKVQPKEAFIETGKQLVGDLREGLWTFFEDLRQVTVGEEANVVVKGNQLGERVCTPKKQTRISNRERAALPNQEERRTNTPSRNGGDPCVPHDQLLHMDEDIIDTEEDESWDSWGTPVAGTSATLDQASSVNSESFASSSSGRSPRSSLR